MSTQKNYKITVKNTNLSFPIDNEGTINFWKQRLDDIATAMAENSDYTMNFIDWDNTSAAQLMAFLTRPDEHTLVLNRIFSDENMAMGYFSKYLPLLIEELGKKGYASTFEVIDFDESTMSNYDFILHI